MTTPAIRSTSRPGEIPFDRKARLMSRIVITATDLLPAPGEIVRVRSRRTFVESLSEPRREGDQSLLRLSCLQDDAEGEPQYLMIHMIHLIEPTDNARFVALMDGAMPQWRIVQEQLNRLPVRHDEWAY